MGEEDADQEQDTGGKNAPFEDCKKMIPTQAEVDKGTHTVNKKYPDEVYRNFSNAKKQKLWQL